MYIIIYFTLFYYTWDWTSFSVKNMSKVKQPCSLFLYCPGFSVTKGTLPCNTPAGRNILASAREWLKPFLCHPTWGHWINLPQPVASMRKPLHQLWKGWHHECTPMSPCGSLYVYTICSLRPHSLVYTQILSYNVPQKKNRPQNGD